VLSNRDEAAPPRQLYTYIFILPSTLMNIEVRR